MNMDMKDIFRHRIGSISLILSLLTMALASQSVMAQDPINLSNVKFEIVCEDTVEMGKNPYRICIGLRRPVQSRVP